MAATSPDPNPNRPLSHLPATFGSTPGYGGTMGTGGSANLKQSVSKAAQRYGWSGKEFNALDQLIQKESSWNPKAQNPTSTQRGGCSNF